MLRLSLLIHWLCPIYGLSLPLVEGLNLWLCLRIVSLIKPGNCVVGKSILYSRRVFTTVGFIGCSVVLLPLPLAEGLTPWLSTLLFSMSMGFIGFQPAGYKANYLDVSVKYVGIVSGVGNTIGTVASFAGPILVAFIVEEYESWSMVWLSVFVCSSLAAVVFLFYSATDIVEDDIMFSTSTLKESAQETEVVLLLNEGP